MYRYADGNPISRIDPFGLQAIPIPGPSPWLPPGASPGTSTPPYTGPYIEEEWLGGFADWIRGLFSDKAREECEQRCDAQWDADVFQCEWLWKMKGRPTGDFNACYKAARERYLQCYQDCKNECK